MSTISVVWHVLVPKYIYPIIKLLLKLSQKQPKHPCDWQAALYEFTGIQNYCSPFGCADRVLIQFSTVCVGFITSTAHDVWFYFTFSFPHTIFEYMYFLYAPNFVVCVCIRMCGTLKRCAWPFHCLYYHSIRWRMSEQMCIKRFEKMALITLYILFILSSIQFVQRSNGITWSNCTHGFVWCVWYFTFKSTFIFSLSCLFFVCFFFCRYCSFFQYNVLTFDSLFATRRSIYSNDNVLTSLFQPARLSSFFPALTFACFMDVIRIYFLCFFFSHWLLVLSRFLNPFFQKSWFANLMKYLVSYCMYVFYNQSIYTVYSSVGFFHQMRQVSVFQKLYTYQRYFTRPVIYGVWIFTEILIILFPKKNRFQPYDTIFAQI